MKKYKVVFHMEAPIKSKDKNNWIKIFKAISNKMEEYVFDGNGHDKDDIKKFYKIKEIK